MTILALDLGSNLGWSIIKRDGTIKGGTQSFAPAKHGGHGKRFLALIAFLTQIRMTHGPIQAVYYEDVKQHAGTLAAHAYGGFLAIVQTWCATNGDIRLCPLGVGAIKKAWTGKGNAKKELMIASARLRGFSPVDDNHADALAILRIGCANEGWPFDHQFDVKQGQAELLKES